MRPLPVDVQLADAPITFVDDLARCLTELTGALDVDVHDALARERRLLEDVRRKSHAQHRGSKHRDALSAATRHSRDVTALDARGKLERLIADVGATIRAARSLDRGEACATPARAAAEACAMSALATCRALERLASACEDVVEAFAGQLARSYFMPLALVASACASRVRCECAAATGALVRTYNAAMRLRDVLPPPGSFGSRGAVSVDSDGYQRLPPAEIRVATSEDGGTRAVAMGDDKAKADEELNRAWANAVIGQSVAQKSDVNIENDIGELGVRVDRADESDRPMVVVAKKSQVPLEKTIKYERAVSTSSALGAQLGGIFSSKKRRRKKKEDVVDESAKDASKKQKASSKEAPKSKEEALERLRQLSTLGSFGSW